MNIVLILICNGVILKVGYLTTFGKWQHHIFVAAAKQKKILSDYILPMATKNPIQLPVINVSSRLLCHRSCREIFSAQLTALTELKSIFRDMGIMEIKWGETK